MSEKTPATYAARIAAADSIAEAEALLARPQDAINALREAQGRPLPQTTSDPGTVVRRIKPRRDSRVPAETRGKQSQRHKGKRRQTTERAWAAADAKAQRVHDHGETPELPLPTTVAQRDFIAGYVIKHGPRMAEWPRTARRHFKRQARLQGLTD